jgi:hypothetical protein
MFLSFLGVLRGISFLMATVFEKAGPAYGNLDASPPDLDRFLPGWCISAFISDSRRVRHLVCFGARPECAEKGLSEV